MKYINNKYYGLFNEIDSVENPTDLQIFNCVDTGKQYRFFEGKWYKQPVYWVDRDNAGGGGGSDLPDVTAVDNGKVLGVVNGEWDKTALSGGGDDLFVVNIWWELEGYECSKTFEELVSAYNDMKTILCILDFATPHSTISFVEDSSSVTAFKAWFFSASRETEDRFNLYTITIDSEGISDTFKSYTLSPDDM